MISTHRDAFSLIIVPLETAFSIAGTLRPRYIVPMLPFTPFNTPEHDPFLLEGGKPAALLVHGFPGSPSEMRATGQLLNELGFTAHGPLLPGFGKEIETLPTLKMENWLDAVSRAWASLRRDHSPCILVGNSMGGALALAAAAKNPPDALILFAPFWKLPGLLWAGLPFIRRILPEVRPFRIMKPNFDDPEFRKGAANFSPELNLDDPAVRAAMIDFPIPIGVFDEIRRAGVEGHQAVPHVPCPVLIIQGTNDPLVRPHITKSWLGQLPGPVTLVEVPAGHDSYDAHRPAWPQVSTAIKAFVSKNIGINHA